MSLSFANRKRIRGWPQMVKRLKNMEDSYSKLNFELLTEYQWKSYELLLAPFSNLTKRNPPGWFFGLYFESMLRIMKSWKADMDNQGVDYYLAIWLFEPRITLSQVVVAIGDRIKYYEDLFQDFKGIAKLPQRIPLAQRDLYWKPYLDIETKYFDLDDTKDEALRSFRTRGYRELVVDREVTFKVPAGVVWVYRVT